jgi:hypothetical protein
MVPPTVPITMSAKASLFILPDSITLGKVPVLVEMLCLEPKGDWLNAKHVNTMHVKLSNIFFITK